MIVTRSSSATAWLIGSLATAAGFAAQAEEPSLVFHPSASWEWGVWGQNLLDPRHSESTTPYGGVATQVPRSVVAKITKRF